MARASIAHVDGVVYTIAVDDTYVYMPYPSLLLSLSAGANLWPFLIIGPDGQLRFAYWSIAAICIALLIAKRDIARVDEVGTEPVFSPS